jgi:hypothetical protein
MGEFASSYASSFDTSVSNGVPVIPPDSILGPIEERLPAIMLRVATILHTEDPEIETAVLAAVIFVIDQTNRNTVGLPDDALTIEGLVGFSTRIYLDAYSPNGSQVAIADPTFEPIFQPENLWKHWRHYFRRLYPRWGIA